jgi:hypothetical protein
MPVWSLLASLSLGSGMLIPFLLVIDYLILALEGFVYTRYLDSSVHILLASTIRFHDGVTLTGSCAIIVIDKAKMELIANFTDSLARFSESPRYQEPQISITENL